MSHLTQIAVFQSEISSVPAFCFSITEGNGNETEKNFACYD